LVGGIWNLLEQFGIHMSGPFGNLPSGNLVSCFGILNKEKSGNPGDGPHFLGGHKQTWLAFKQVPKSFQKKSKIQNYFARLHFITAFLSPFT
jgi:hypothetical protein